MSDLAVGQTVRLPDGRSGIVRFVGNTHFASGDWVGVELEDDSGKNDGSVQGERYFDCSMGHGPPAAAKPARRPSRPTSFNPGTGRTASDAGLTKRMSLNAPSPSPGPKAARPPSILRCSVTDQVTNKTARISNFEYCAITNYDALEHSYTGRRGEGTAKRWGISHIHGPSRNARFQNYPAALDVFSTDKTDPRKTHERSTLNDWAGDDLCQTAVCGFGSWEAGSGQWR
ncbi:dynactin, isoform [Colletotrichum spaethianum]|uniref:Dynactin, isoform n=1 Tax=Colletotrichum spaethianum TaxID=700344 RepID=A0AA37PCZ4_9PEZI|nr:dynactin, isoform [Colletotrichum spaethianum]GKT49924.1 dynactin, isoform [Colletotrichum spaethianum]